jgi:hypothetical protein
MGEHTGVVNGGPKGRPAGTEAKRRPLTTTATTTKHNENRPPVRAGLTSQRAARSAAHKPPFCSGVLC